MKHSVKSIYLAMYYSLEELYEKNKSEELLVFISDADPTLCNDEKSIDPVVYDQFSLVYEQNYSRFENSYDFVVFYLENIDPFYGNIKKYFLQVVKNEFDRKLND